MSQPLTVDDLVVLAEQLSTIEKVRLIERLAPQIAHDLQSEQAKPRKSLRGLWRGSKLDADDINAARREMWRNFPREDI
jgi:hypothetical protein